VTAFTESMVQIIEAQMRPLRAENERLRNLVTEARQMFEWLAADGANSATDAWMAKYIARSAIDRPADAGSGEPHG
jgi:hypothetical protein